MQGFKSILQIIFYFIWIPLGLLLFILIIFLIINNPLRQIGALGGGPPGGGFQGGGPAGGFPGEEMMKKQMMQKGEQNGPGEQPREGFRQRDNLKPR